MRKKIEQVIKVDISICNICGLEVVKEPFNKERLKVVRGLLKLEDFDAHEACINQVIRIAFKNVLAGPKKIKRIKGRSAPKINI